MVKIHCDRCGEEIKNKYYTINIYEYDTNPKCDCDTAANYAAAYSNTRDDILRTLNATKMYCEKCRYEIIDYIERKFKG